MTTALIAEDEAALAEELADMLAELWPELRIVAKARNGEEALELYMREKPDIVFLDIQMPDPNGLQVARILREQCHIVFVTAYDEHALDAFERGAVDYILKPVSDARLALTVDRLKRRLAQPPAAIDGVLDELEGPRSTGRHLRWITASLGESLRLITVDEVVFFQAAQKYTRVVLANSEVLVKRSLKELVDELDPDQFWQTHRSTVVNAMQIASITPNLAGKPAIVLKTRREQLPVSEAFVRRFRQM